jgi:tetratricopeptide (TPR) repeat protein
MSIFRKTILLFLCTGFVLKSNSQDATAITALKQSLATAVTAGEKTDLLDRLSKMSMSTNLSEAEAFGKQLIQVAEESRDRKLMVKAYLSNGTRCSYFASRQEYMNRAVEFYDKALTIAKENKLDDDIGAAYLHLSAVYVVKLDKDKALSYANEASAVISTHKNDSLKTEVYINYGNVYLVMNEKILALRNYLNALRSAEEQRSNPLQRSCYLNLSSFYASIEEYDKAIDYAVQAYNKLAVINNNNSGYQRAIDLNNIGNLYAYKKSQDMAITYFERSLAVADSLKFPTLKIPGYVSLLNHYLRLDQPQKALDYFNSEAGQNLRKHLEAFGFSAVIAQAFAVIYTELGKFDSAGNYFKKAMPFFETGSSETQKMNFYGQLAHFYEKKGENDKAIDYYLLVKDIALKNSLLENVEMSAKHLDSLYNKTANFQLASQYNAVYYTYKDSVAKLNKEKELAQVEATDEQQRQERIQKEEEEREVRKNNIQYMAITIGIAALFVALVILGMFKVPANAIRAIGFFSFLLFFEFIFLVFKKNIHSLTHGEPWKDLAFMIALAAVLVPLHHWLEHKVIKYLTSHNRLTASGKTLMSKVFAGKKSDDEKSKM